MADNNNADKERIKLLEEQNRLYKKQLELQAEGYSLSTSYVESLKEVLGINSKLSTEENNLLSLNKKINKEILNQKVAYESINEVQKQIKKNDDLIEKSQKLERSLINSITTERQKQVDKTARAFQLQTSLSKSIEDAYKNLEEGKQVNLDILKAKKAQLAAVEKETNRRVGLLSSEEKKLLYTKLQQEELKKQNVEREREKEALENVSKSLGLSGMLMKGISKIPFLKDIPGISNVLKDVEKEIKEINALREKEGKEPLSRTEALKMTFSKMKGVITQNLTDPLVIAGFLFTQFLDALKSADKATGDLAKDFNVTYNEAANIREELIQIGNLSGNVALNARALQESMVAVGKALGSNAMLNKADLETFTELREMAGYTNEELVGIQKLTLATGGDLKNNTKQFLGTVSALNAQNKLTVNEKQLLKEVANTSAAIKLSVGGTTEGLAKAAFQAKQFGINLDQADRIAEGLLDFESSITNELSAELITGKDLNLEKARLLALNGDIAGASAEILQQVKGSAEFTKMNRIQQEALAKAVGMSREDLAASLVEREALQQIGVKDAAAAKEKFDLLVKEKGYAAAVAEMGNEQYANQLKQQSIQERFNASVEKLKEIFISIAEPILQIVSPLVDLVTTILPAVNFLLSPLIEGFSYIGKIVGWISSGIQSFSGWLAKGSAAATALKVVLAPIAAIVGIIAAGMIYASLSAIPVIGPFLAPIAVIGMLGLLAKAGAEAAGMKFAKGGIVTGEINNATVGEAGPEAIIPLNSPTADKMLGVNTPKNTTNPSPQQDNSALMNKLDTLISVINNSNNRPIEATFTVDGEVLTKAVGNRPSTLTSTAATKAVKIQ